MLGLLFVGAHPPSTQISHRHRIICTLKVKKGVCLCYDWIDIKGRGYCGTSCSNVNNQDKTMAIN